MAIDTFQPTKSKIPGMAIGFATGGPAGAAESLLSQSNPAIGRAMGVAGAIGGGGGSDSDPQAEFDKNLDTTVSGIGNQFQQPGLGDQLGGGTPSLYSGGAISRRLGIGQ